MDRWVITYRTPLGAQITCKGLLHEGVEQIARAQHALGSTLIVSFRESHQPGDRAERWGADVIGRVCIVAKPRR